MSMNYEEIMLNNEAGVICTRNC